VKDVDDIFSSDAVTAIGTCAKRVPAVSGECLKTLIKLLQSKHGISPFLCCHSSKSHSILSPLIESTIASSILVLRSLLLSSSHPTSTSLTSIITRLVSHLQSGQIRDPTAKATVYWLVGQCVGEDGEKMLKEGCAADVVRLGARDFASEVRSFPAFCYMPRD